jgi:two-component system, NtrC family, sensor kinase
MAKLYVMGGKEEHQSFDLKSETIFIGRGPENDIQIDDKYISRKHLKIQRKGDKYLIQDLNTKNGTFVNGKQISPNDLFELGEGHTIVIGMSVICLDEGSSEDVLALLDSIRPIKTTRETRPIYFKDRMFTPKHNMDFIKKVSEALLASSSSREISEKILGYMFELLKRVDRGTVILTDRKTGKISEVVSKARKETREDIEAYSIDVVARVLKTGEPVIMTDIRDESGGDLYETVKILNIRSVMCIPLISRSKKIGAIYMDSLDEPYAFRKEDLSLFTNLSSRAALALETATVLF